MTGKKKILVLAIVITICLTAAGSTLAWYIREDEKRAETLTAEVMAPYNLYLLNPNAKDSLRFAVGNLHPGEVKNTVICVSNRIPEDYTAEDNMSELVKDSEFNYDLQLVYTENLAVSYYVYLLERYDMPADLDSLPTDAIIMEGDDPAYEQYYWKKASTPIAGTDNSAKMTAEVFGEAATADIVNVGKYMFFDDDNMKLAYQNGTYEYDYYLIEMKWNAISDFDEYKKETDLVYVVVNAKQPRPTEK